MNNYFADKVIKIARDCAAVGSYGCVNDFDPYVPDAKDASEKDPYILAVLNDAKDPLKKGKYQLRFGWRNLKTFYEKAGGFGPEKWKDRATLEGVMLKGKKIPQPGTPGSTGLDWCGIFATWCWVEAGIPDVKWGWPDTKGPWISKIFGSKGIGRGDIGFIAHKSHQFIVCGFQGALDNPNTLIEVVSGNSDYQGIKKETFKMRDIVAYVSYNSLPWAIEKAVAELRKDAGAAWQAITADN